MVEGAGEAGLTLLGDNRAEFKGLETFESPALLDRVALESDEVTALCPVTGQPDWYRVRIEIRDARRSIESKSLKLYLGSFRDVGIFCEALSSRIASDVYAAIGEGSVSVSVTQKPRGGVSIEATSTV